MATSDLIEVPEFGKTGPEGTGDGAERRREEVVEEVEDSGEDDEGYYGEEVHLGRWWVSLSECIEETGHTEEYIAIDTELTHGRMDVRLTAGGPYPMWGRIWSLCGENFLAVPSIDYQRA